MSPKLAAGRHLVLLLALAHPALALASPPAPTPALPHAGHRRRSERRSGLRSPIGERLKLLLQPIHSGWILRVVPGVRRPDADLAALTYADYALLATPPYQSVTPLSLSTDFGFRAQDAAGWNPRRFRFATIAGILRPS